MANPRRYVDAAEAALADAIKRRRKAQGSRAENILIGVIVALPLIAFVISIADTLL